MTRFRPLAALIAAALLAGAVPSMAAGKVNINTASAAELSKVPGLDSQIAVRIVARRAQRPFKSLDELLEVQGVSKLTMISAGEHLEAGPPASTAAATAAPAAAPKKKLDLNKATFAELLLLPEMTPRMAKSIVDWREKNGGFRSVDDLGQVPGVDKRVVIAIVDHVGVNGARAATAEPAPTAEETILLGDEGWSGSWTSKLESPTPTPKPLGTGEKIDINGATREELERLPDIGPVMAQRIVDHRKLNGPFGRVDDLLEVRGIGPTRLTALRPLIVAGAGKPAATPKATPTPKTAVAERPTPAPTPERPAPTPKATTVAAVTRPSAKPAITPDGRVNINVAGIDDLLTLPRMTRAVAQEILDYRAKNGPFRDPHAIVDVPSIGEAAYARIRDKIAVE